MNRKKINIQRDVESRQKISTAIHPLKQEENPVEIIPEPLTEPENAKSEIIQEPAADQKIPETQTPKRGRTAKGNKKAV